MPPLNPYIDPPILSMPSAPTLGPGAVRPGLPDGVPAVLAFNGEQSQFEQRLSAVLQGTIDGLRYDLADFYLLDDRTAELRVAATTGDRRASSRGIEHAAGDVTAMAGEAVVLENQDLMAEFNVPRECGAAVCVPVATDRTIHGSLWMYCRRPRPVSDAELQLVEIVAGRLAVEVERNTLLKSPLSMMRASGVGAVPAPQAAPPCTLVHEELEAAGRDASVHALHEWRALPDGRVLAYAGVYTAAPHARGDAGAMVDLMRKSLNTHAPRAGHTGSLLEHVTWDLRGPFRAGDGVSLAAAMLDPETGSGSYSLAGSAMAVRIRASQQHLDVSDAPPLGFVEVIPRVATPVELEIRERLLLAVGDPRTLQPRRARRLANCFGQLGADEHRQMNAQAAVETLIDRATHLGVQLDSAVALRRR